MEAKIPYIKKSFSYQKIEKDSLSKKEVERIKEHYGKPKSYKSLYSYFCHENATLAPEGLNCCHRNAFLSKPWKELSPTKKEELQERYVEHKKNYEELYLKYLNRLPIELLPLAEKVTALRDTPYNLFLKDVQSKDLAENVKENWDNLSQTKRVKWILKSFEIQESAKKADYKKLVTNDEMAIIFKTLDKPNKAHQSVISMFKEVSEGKNSVKWENLLEKEKQMYRKDFLEHRNDFLEQFAQYLLCLPEICRKSEIIKTETITEDEKSLFMNRFSVKNEEKLKDKKRKVEQEEEENKQTPQKKVKKSDTLDTNMEKQKSRRTGKLSLMTNKSDKIKNKAKTNSEEKNSKRTGKVRLITEDSEKIKKKANINNSEEQPSKGTGKLHLMSEQTSRRAEVIVPMTEELEKIQNQANPLEEQNMEVETFEKEKTLKPLSAKVKEPLTPPT